MYQPQNSQGSQQPPPQQPGQPYPQQPPNYPEVKPLPKGWQTPIQPGQWNPSGVYGRTPEPKKEWPGWATALIIIGAIIIVGIIGFIGSAIKGDTTQVALNTNVPVPGNTPTVAHQAANDARPTATNRPTPTDRPAPTPRPTATLEPTETPLPPTITPNIPGTKAAVANITELARQKAQNAQATIDAFNKSLKDAFSKPTEIGVKVGGAGQELVGQIVNDNGLNVIVSKVERFSQIYNYDKSLIQTSGVFLVINYDLFNGSQQPQTLIFIKLADAQGRTYSPTTNIDANLAVAFIGNYQDDLTVQPSLWGKGYSVFEIPKDATNLKLKVGF